MTALVRTAGGQLIRRRFGSIEELLRLLQDSLVDYLESRGAIQERAFEERPCPGATLDDIDADTVARFVRRARHERQFPLPEQTPVADVLTHLHLLRDGQPSMTAMLLFGRDPQRFVPAAEMRCMHFHGTAVQRPAPSYQIYKGNLADQVDQGADFVLSKLNRSVGTREHGPAAPVAYEIPPDAVREAIVNAVAHRDYASSAAVQVSVFTDRVEVWNPGALPPELTPARLREPHGSVPRNPRICEALFLARYIEKYGTGTLMMIRESVENGLPEPTFEQRGGEFVLTLWRDWLTTDVLSRLGLNERQKEAITHLKVNGRVSNLEYQSLLGVAKRTALRDLVDLLEKGIIERIGTTGKGTYYVLVKGAGKGPNGPPELGSPKGAIKGPKGP
jgi:ATP-dependent DNA helicase RecG